MFLPAAFAIIVIMIASLS